MEKQIKGFLILAIILMQSGIAISQRQVDLSKMKANVKYKIVLTDNNDIYGRFISADSSGIKIETDERIVMLIPKEKISFYTANLAPDKYKFSVSLLGGVSFLMGKYYPYEETSGNMTQLTLDMSAILYLSDSKAIKADAGYTRVKVAGNTNGVSLPPYYSSVSGGNLNMLSFKGSFLLGRFKPSEKFMFYGSLGLGVNFAERDDVTFYPSDSTYLEGTSTILATLWINPVICVGCAAGYRFSKHFGVSAELEYNMLIGTGDNFFSGKHNYLPLRAGVFYIF